MRGLAIFLFCVIIIHMKELTPKIIKTYKTAFEAQPQNKVLQRAINNNGIYAAARNPRIVHKNKNLWSYEIPTGEVRDQIKTGTCWLMAALVLAEKTVGENLKVENLKLSSSYLYFYDKLEMSNSFLQKIIDTSDEDLKSRHVQEILRTKQYDGGWWSEAAELIEKYGVVPESVMPATKDAENSSSINAILNEKLTLGAKKLRESKNPQELKVELMAEIYKILTLSFGTPPEEFNFDFIPKKDEDKKKSDKDKNADKKPKNAKDLQSVHSTPQDFWKKYGTNLRNFVTLDFLLDHKKDQWNTFYETDSVDFMYGKPEQTATVKFSAEIEKAIKKQIKNDEPVWFSWDTGKQFSSKTGVLDSDIWKYDDIYGQTERLDKDFRGIYRDHSGAGFHATAIVGYREENGAITHWKVKNSWGKELGQNGYISMSSNYLQDYVLGVIVRKKYLPKSVRDIFSKIPVIVRYWD